MKTIEIRTTHNVSIEYDPATLWERLVAVIIDIIIVSALYLLLVVLVISSTSGNTADADQGWMWFLGLLPISGFILYHFLSEVLANGQSWGKRAMNIKVMRLDGKQAGLSDSLLRAVFYLVDGIFTLGILGAILISSTPRHQRLGDIAANTTVIKLKPGLYFDLDDILRINTLDNYEPMYPAVRQYSEQDMLLIKNVLYRYRRYPNDVHRQTLIELADRIRAQLGVEDDGRHPVDFLDVLIRDYIVLTR